MINRLNSYLLLAAFCIFLPGRDGFAIAPNNLRDIAEVTSRYRGGEVNPNLVDLVYHPNECNGRNGGDEVHLYKARVFGKDTRAPFTGQYAKYQSLFKGTGLLVTTRNDGQKMIGTYEFVGNCHTIVTAAHNLFSVTGVLSVNDLVLFPQIVDGTNTREINPADYLAEGRIHYIKGKNVPSSKGEPYDVVALSLNQDVPNCGAYNIRPLGDTELSKVSSGNLVEVAFNDDKYDSKGNYYLTIDPSCSKIDYSKMNKRAFEYSGYDFNNLLFHDCDNASGSSGGGDFFVDREGAVNLTAINVGTNLGGGRIRRIAKDVSVPDSKVNQYPNISVRLRSPYFEAHPLMDPNQISDYDYKTKFRCVRANEINEYPAFWLIEDAAHQYHEPLNAEELKERCGLVRTAKSI